MLMCGKFLSYFIPLSSLFDYETDTVYWIISLWTLVEGVQHYFYKLVYGRRDAFVDMLIEGGAIDFRRPFSGTIGIQLRKLRNEIKHVIER